MKKEETILARHNYSKYSNKGNKPNVNSTELKPITNTIDESASHVEPVVNPELITIPTPEVKLAKETTNTVTLPSMVKGVVVDCVRLNVRANPTTESEIVCVLDVDSEIKVDVIKSTKEWFSICTASGVTGYCMRKFVDAHL